MLLEVWATRMALKQKLFDYIKEQFRETWLKNQGDPSRVVNLLEKMNPNALVIGFCRRFATYKRAHLLFTDEARLAKIVNDPEHPVIFLFAGKAHPADGAGQGLIKRIYEISQRPEFPQMPDTDVQTSRPPIVYFIILLAFTPSYEIVLTSVVSKRTT